MTKEQTTDNQQKQDEIKPEGIIPKVRNELSKVASSPKQSFLIMAVICVVGAYFVYTTFSSKTTDAPKQEKLPVPKEVVRPVETTESDVPSIPKLPEPPKLLEPTPLPPPPVEVAKTNIPIVESVSSLTSSNIPTINSSIISRISKNKEQISINALPDSNLLVDDEELKKRQDAKRKSNIILIAGNVPKKTQEQITEEADFKNRGNMKLVLGKGKIIYAVLESAINTDLISEVRAVISRDVFAESGNTILIPKGSRVFGTYGATADDSGYGRISIAWNRIDMANGYTINLEGLGVDNLGRKGDQGRLDNKLKERLSNAVLMSAFNIALAEGLDKVVKPPENSQAAAQNQATSNNITQLIETVRNNSALDSSGKRSAICSQVQAAIPDKTSSAYSTFSNTCIQANTMSGNEDQKLQYIIIQANSAALALVTTANTQVNPSQAQQASKQAFTDITDALKESIPKQQVKPTITIDQGTPVKIYVNKDYKFPKSAISGASILK